MPCRIPKLINDGAAVMPRHTNEKKKTHGGLPGASASDVEPTPSPFLTAQDPHTRLLGVGHGVCRVVNPIMRRMDLVRQAGEVPRRGGKKEEWRWASGEWWAMAHPSEGIVSDTRRGLARLQSTPSPSPDHCNSQWSARTSESIKERDRIGGWVCCPCRHRTCSACRPTIGSTILG